MAQRTSAGFLLRSPKKVFDQLPEDLRRRSHSEQFTDVKMTSRHTLTKLYLINIVKNPAVGGCWGSQSSHVSSLERLLVDNQPID